MDIRKVFGANARRFRVALGLSQEAVAERMGVDRAFVSSMERGQKTATLLTIWKFPKAWGPHPEVLLEKKVPRFRPCPPAGGAEARAGPGRGYASPPPIR